MARKRTETATETSKETKARRKFTKARKCMKTTTKKFHESAKHRSGREEKSPSKCSAESLSSLDQSLLLNTQDRTPKVNVLDLHSSKKVRSSGKMKLQLFPLDARTREGLEKDGFHPYLELTLSSRKKISSVLQHIHNKWGCSEIALGDPRLYPWSYQFSTQYTVTKRKLLILPSNKSDKAKVRGNCSSNSPATVSLASSITH